MIVVTNAGPLMALAKLGLLHLLGRLYEKVLMPGAVYDEVVLRGMEQGFSDSLQVRLAIQQKYLVVKAVNKQSADIVALPLHKGEKETLSLSLEHNADLVLLDDMLARSDAQALGFSVKGTLGVITKGYNEEILSLDEVRIIFDSIIERNDIWIAEGLCRSVFDGLKNRN
jgi:predicted nucleic acid-binding protein